MSSAINLATSEREVITQYADWYAQQGYQVSVAPRPGELPEFLRTLAPDLVATRGDENIVVEIKTSSPYSFDQVRDLARALEHRAGWKLQVVYTDIVDPEWAPPSELLEPHQLLARVSDIEDLKNDGVDGAAGFLLLWSIFEAAARHRLSSSKIASTERISSSALLKMLLTEGIIEEDEYAKLRRSLAVRNALTHGFLNQTVDREVYEELRRAAKKLLRTKARTIASA